MKIQKDKDYPSIKKITNTKNWEKSIYFQKV